MSKEYQAAQQKYQQLAKAAANGDTVARADKAKVVNEIRAIEREAARAGTVLSAVVKGDKVEVHTQDAPSKRSLQEEYVRKFDAEKKVNLGGKEQTLRDYHSKRLLGK